MFGRAHQAKSLRGVFDSSVGEEGWCVYLHLHVPAAFHAPLISSSNLCPGSSVPALWFVWAKLHYAQYCTSVEPGLGHGELLTTGISSGMLCCLSPLNLENKRAIEASRGAGWLLKFLRPKAEKETSLDKVTSG